MEVLLFRFWYKNEIMDALGQTKPDTHSPALVALLVMI